MINSMTKNKFLISLICTMPLVIAVAVLQRITNMTDFFRGALTGICIGLQLMCLISFKRKKQLQNEL